MQKPEPFVNGDTVFSVTDASALLKGVVETALFMRFWLHLLQK